MFTTISTLADQHPDFIEYQNASIRRYVKGKYEHLVFNNARNKEMRENINAVCDKLEIKAIELQCNYSQPGSIIQAEAMNKAWERYLKNRPGCSLWIDIDMFFISSINIGKLAENYDIGYIPIYRNNFGLECMWAGIIFLNTDIIDKSIKFDKKRINNTLTDAGGSTYYYLKKHPDYRKLYFAADSIWEVEDGEIKTNLNHCSDYVFIQNDFINREPVKKLFPHEKENDNYWEKYRKRFKNHENIIEKYSFPEPYYFDLIRIEEDDSPFIFHYKSASWHRKYGVWKNKYSTDKKEALKRFLDKGK